jgi:hypothetical protein
VFLGECEKSKIKRQKAKGKNEESRTASISKEKRLHFCLLPFAFCLLPFDFLTILTDSSGVSG